MNCRTNKKESIELSIKEKTYDGWDNIEFTSEIIPFSDLENIFKSKNFSPIKWNGSRSQANFCYATGFVVDIDKHGWTIEKAKQILKDHNLNYALITSRSHTEEAHRFHILLPFDRKVYSLQNYEEVTGRIYKELFPKSDDQVLGGERYIFGSKEDSLYSSCFTGENYQVDDSPHIRNAWTDDFEVRLSKNKTMKATEVEISKGKTIPIYCPFHDDNSPSAFLAYSEVNLNHFIHCSSCGRTYWKIQTKDIVILRCEPFFSYQTTVTEASIVGDKFFLESIGKEKFFIRAGAKSKEDQDNYFSFITCHKHIKGLNRIDQIGDVTIEKSEYMADLEKGLITVRIKAIDEKMNDNGFIEDYLGKVFGQYKPFIKEWLAVYCYTNYKKLPTLILTGERGTGKNTFAEPIYEIFPTLSGIVKDIHGDFNPSAEQKLMIIDESDSKGKMQYQTLKKLSGQKYVEINKKYVPQYQVWNNLNVIFLSNEELPIYVEREEMPNDESNNQFFVYRFPKLSGKIDANLQTKITDRLGHYIRTELKTVFEGLNTEGFRYSIRVPITEEEKKLFRNSITEEEAEADRIIDQFESNITNRTWIYYPFIQAGYLPSEFIDDVLGNSKRLKSKIIQNLKKRGYLEDSNAERYQADNKRLYCQKLGKVWLDEVKKLKNQIHPKKVAVSPFTNSQSGGHLSHQADPDQLGILL